MTTSKQLGSLTVLLACAALVALPGPVAVGAADNDGVIRGVVTSADGPEAGVWVIAETDDLETVFRKIVVTDDAGRYVLPELPDATYDVWVRGYGLVDSAPVAGRPDQALDLTAVVAATPQAAAQVYPSNYWLALIDLPASHEFPGTGPDGNGINPVMGSQSEVDQQPQGLPALPPGRQPAHPRGPRRRGLRLGALGLGRPHAARPARVAHVQLHHPLRPRARARHCRSTGATGLPPARRRRPRRGRRASSATWCSRCGTGATTVVFVHDEIATDKRNPRVNANGPLYGVDIGNDFLLVTDTAEHRSEMIQDSAARQRPAGAVDVRHRGLQAVARLRRRGRLERSGQPAQPDDRRRAGGSG